MARIPALLIASVLALAALVGVDAPADAGNPAIGPRMLTQVVPGSTDAFDGFAPAFTVLGNRAFFMARTYRHGRELWVSDGTPPGTHLVKDINRTLIPASEETAGSNPTNITAFRGKVYFGADAGRGTELWVSDGTAGGTRAVRTGLQKLSSLMVLTDFTVAGDRLYFVASYPSASAQPGQLWSTDGTTAGTRKVTDLARVHSGASHITSAAALGNDLVFSGWSATGGRELWRSDGTTAGTGLIKDLISDGAGSDPTELTTVGTRVYFRAREAVGSTTTTLWVSDGTAAGTRPVFDTGNGNRPISPTALTVFGGKLLLSARKWPAGPATPWTSDGTVGGTTQVTVPAVAGFTSAGAVDGFVVSGARAYFSGRSDVAGDELWATDGTSAGTVLVKDIRSGADGSTIRGVARLGAGVVLTARTTAEGVELWHSDGTSAGTHPAGDIVPGTGSPEISGIATSGSVAWFGAAATGTGTEPWVYEPGPTYLSWATLSVSSRLAYGRGATLTVRVGSGAPLTHRRVSVYDGAKLLCSATLTGGRATCAVPRTWPVGTHRLRAEYAGGGLVRSSATARAVTVVKAAPRVGLTVRGGSRPQAAVTVAATGLTPTGRVSVTATRGSARTVVVRQLRAAQRGKVTVGLGTLSRGTWKIKVSYAGSATIAAGASATRALRVG